VRNLINNHENVLLACLSIQPTFDKTKETHMKNENKSMANYRNDDNNFITLTIVTKMKNGGHFLKIYGQQNEYFQTTRWQKIE
jgi:hypothetical protein